jgi:hypothetical protein
VLFLSTGVIILYLVFQSQNAAFKAQCELDGIPLDECNLIDKLISDFQQAQFGWLLIIYLLFILSNISRTMRWKMLIQPLGKDIRISTGFLAIMIGYFTNLGFPRIGEVIRAGAVARYEGIKLEKVIGTVVVDRIFDLFTLLLCILLAMLLEWDKLFELLSRYANIELNMIGILKLLVPVFVFGILLYYVWRNRSSLRRYKFFDWFISKLNGLIVGLLSIRNVRKPLWFAFHSINIWVCYYFMTFFGLKVLEQTSNLAPDAALVAFIFGAFGFVIPSPGGMGTYHFLMTKALEIYGVNSVDGFSLANILFFSIQIGCNVTLGVISLVLLSLLNRKKKAEKAEAPI